MSPASRCRRRQDIAYQRFKLNFAKCAARALVAKQFLQIDDAAGQSLDFFLCFINRRQARHHVGEGFIGFLEPLVEPLIDLAADLLEPRIEIARQCFGHGEQLLLQPVCIIGERAGQPVALLG